MKSKFLGWGAIVMSLALLPLRGDWGGEAGRASRFLGKLNLGASRVDQCDFLIEIEPVMFQVNSFKNRYKVVRIRVENRIGGPITLSREEDAIEAELADGTRVRGTFNLQQKEAELWDALSEELRKTVAYPLAIRGAKGDDAASRRPEVIYLFAFFPVEKLPEMPRVFWYKIKSVDQPVELRLPGATAA